MRAGAKIQGEAPAKANSMSVKSMMSASNNRGCTERENFQMEFTKSSEANEGRKGEVGIR